MGGRPHRLELQWGRTIGQLPSPYTTGEPVGRAVPLGSGALDATSISNAGPSIQMIILTVVALIAGAMMVFNFIGLPALLFGWAVQGDACTCPKRAACTRAATSPGAAPKSAV